MNPKLAKLGTKLGLSVAVSTLIGYMIKAELAVEDKIEAHYDRKSEERKNPSDPQ